MMRVIVCGSRQYPLPGLVRARVELFPEETVVLVGQAPTPKRKDPAFNVDLIAERAARERGLPVEVYPPDWDRHGKRAPHARNDEMLRAEPDRMIAFHNGLSAGTASMISKARMRMLPTEVWGPEGQEMTVDAALRLWRGSYADHPELPGLAAEGLRTFGRRDSW